MAIFRLFISGIVSFAFYAAWAWYANSFVTQDDAILLKAAIVQGSYSGGMTLGFTAMLELLFKKFGANTFCLALITPRWSYHSAEKPCATRGVFWNALNVFKKQKIGLPGKLVVPLPALLIQSVLVIAVNVYFATPNLWATVLPSIFFSGVYGYVYSFSLSKKLSQNNAE